MGHHEPGRRRRPASFQEFCAAMLAHLGGLPDDPEPVADEWASPDEWARQHSGKAANR